jgi:hypothetical protein
MGDNWGKASLRSEGSIEHRPSAKTPRSFRKGVIAALLMLTVLLVAGVPIITIRVKATGVSWLHTCGTQICDAQNNPITLHGLDLATGDGEGIALSDFQNIQSTGFNAVRFADFWAQIEPTDELYADINTAHFTTGQYPLPSGVGVDQLVNWAVQTNTYFIFLVCWDNYWVPPNWAFPGVSDDATRWAMLFNGTATKEITGLENVWKYIAKRYANVPNVLFEFENEPYLTSSTDYLAGSDYANFNIQLISAAESVETAPHLKLVETVYNSTTHWVDYPGTVDIAKTNLVWVMHYYAPMQSYDPNGSYWVEASFTWNGVTIREGWHNGSTYIAGRIIRVANMVHGWSKPLIITEFGKDTSQANWQSWLGTVMQITTQFQVTRWFWQLYGHDASQYPTWNLNTPSVAAAVMPILDPYMTTTTSTFTSTGNFVTGGTLQVVQVACPRNVGCGPVYLLVGDDGKTYQLIFSSGLNLPQVGQRMEIVGIIQNTTAICFLSGQKVQCQPISLVIVEGWRPV